MDVNNSDTRLSDKNRGGDLKENNESQLGIDFHSDGRNQDDDKGEGGKVARD